jgi:hypothetical protein
MGLVAGRRCAWVDLLSVAPDGILLRSISMVDPHCATAVKRRCHAAMPQLSAALGSSLATVGTSLLGPGLVRGLAEWGQRSGSAKSASTVRVLVAPANRDLPAYFMDGQLYPLVDPDDGVLAVQLERADVTGLIASLRYPCPRIPRTSRTD